MPRIERMSAILSLLFLVVLTSVRGQKPTEVISDGDSDSSRGTVQGDTWTWQSETKVASKVIKERFIYKEVSADAATMRGELQGDDGRWNLLMEMKARRVK